MMQKYLEMKQTVGLEQPKTAKTTDGTRTADLAGTEQAGTSIEL